MKSSFDNKVNNLLKNPSFWLKCNRLALNANETKYVIFQPMNKRSINKIEASLNSTVLEQRKVQAFLKA